MVVVSAGANTAAVEQVRQVVTEAVQAVCAGNITAEVAAEASVAALAQVGSARAQAAQLHGADGAGGCVGCHAAGNWRHKSGAAAVVGALLDALSALRQQPAEQQRKTRWPL